MRSISPSWTDSNVLRPIRHGRVSRLVVAALAIYGCALGVRGVYPGIFAGAPGVPLAAADTAATALTPAAAVSPVPVAAHQPANASRSASASPESRTAAATPASRPVAATDGRAVGATVTQGEPAVPAQPAALPAAETKPRAVHRRSARANGSVEVYVTPEGRRVYGYRPERSAFGAWERTFANGGAFGMQQSRGAFFQRPY